MKTEITAIGILLCLLTACDITNSSKTQPFNPQYLDGLYKFTYERHDPAQNFYTNYMLVDYPDMKICAVNGEGYPPFTTIGKEEVKVAQKKENFFTIEEVNGHRSESKNVTYKITKDSSRIDGITAYDLYFNKIKNEEEYYGIGFEKYSDDDFHEEYQKCISQASDTTGIFPSTAETTVKPE